MTPVEARGDAPPARTFTAALVPIGKRTRIAALVIGLALLLPAGARLVANEYRGDTVWRNALASLGGVQRNGDFGYVFLAAGDAVRAGENPYLDPDEFLGRNQAPYAYPPVLALLVAPVSALPEWVRGIFVPGILFSLVLVFSVVGALRLLGVRDWRCYPLAFLYPVTLEAIEYGAIGPVLLLLVALGWRFRDTPWAVAAATGGVVVLKLFLWPVVFWLAVTGRVRSATLAILGAVFAVLLSWSVIALRGIADYPRLLEKLVDIEAEHSYSAFAVFRMLGVSELAARALVIVAGATLLGSAWKAARSVGRSPAERDARSLTLTIAAALVMTPILWLHYFVLLLIPIALARPRLSLLWFAPLALVVFEAFDLYSGWPYGDPEALLSVVAVVTGVFVLALSSLRRVGGMEVALPGRGR